jgi:hypothetical protein
MRDDRNEYIKGSIFHRRVLPTREAQGCALKTYVSEDIYSSIRSLRTDYAEGCVQILDGNFLDLRDVKPSFPLNQPKDQSQVRFPASLGCIVR